MSQIARQLNRSRSGVFKLVKQGRIPRLQNGKFNIDDVKQALNQDVDRRRSGYYVARFRTVKGLCIVCGNKFEFERSRGRDKVTCSRLCKWEQTKENHRRWAHANPGRCKDDAKKYRERTAVATAARRRERYAADQIYRAKANEATKKWCAVNPDKVRARSNSENARRSKIHWMARNPERVNAYHQNALARRTATKRIVEDLGIEMPRGKRERARFISCTYTALVGLNLI